MADVDQFPDGLLMGFTQLFTGVITILGTLGFMLLVNVQITLVVVLITPLSLFVASFIAKKTYFMFKLQSETRGEQTALIDEMIGNQKVVQAFCHEDETQERFDEINERLQKCSLQCDLLLLHHQPVHPFCQQPGVRRQSVSPAHFAADPRRHYRRTAYPAFLSYANQYTKPFNEISGVVTELQNALACAARIFELIEEEPQIPDEQDAGDLKDVKGTCDAGSCELLLYAGSEADRGF